MWASAYTHPSALQILGVNPHTKINISLIQRKRVRNATILPLRTWAPQPLEVSISSSIWNWINTGLPNSQRIKQDNECERVF